MTIKNFLENTKIEDAPYARAMTAQRLYGGNFKPSGSFVIGVDSVESMEDILLAALWTLESEEEAKKVFVARLDQPMKLGIVAIDQLDSAQAFYGLNPKDDPTKPIESRPHSEVGILLTEESISQLPDAEVVRLIVLKHREKEDFWFAVTWFPDMEQSVVMEPSKIKATDLPHGTKLSKEEAQNFGFVFAKIAVAI